MIVGNSALPHIFSGIFWGLEARAPFTNNDTSDATVPNTATLATIGLIGKLAVYSSNPQKDRKHVFTIWSWILRTSVFFGVAVTSIDGWPDGWVYAGYNVWWVNINQKKTKMASCGNGRSTENQQHVIFTHYRWFSHRKMGLFGQPHLIKNRLDPCKTRFHVWMSAIILYPPRLQQGERVRGEINSSKGQEVSHCKKQEGKKLLGATLW